MINNNFYNTVINSEKIHERLKYLWSYQYKLSSQVLVPYLTKLKAFQENISVVEIGCGEGGVLTAFVEAGASKALGTDIDEGRLNIGREIAELTNQGIEYLYHNITQDEPIQTWKNKADLVLLRDVIEHLDNTALSLKNIKNFLKPGGCLFVTFPPYYTPFGGHQHILKTGWGKIPYIHFLPNFIFHKLLSSGHPYDIAEIKRLQNIRLTPKKFVRAVQEAGFSIVHKDFYLLRPVFKMKFGLPTIKLTPLSFIPFVKSFFSLEAAYILKIDN
jgi:SAM-dependent methyltransferase